MAKQTYGCTSIINAVCLQFELAGHGLYTSVKRSGKGYVCCHAIKRVTKPTFMEQWLAQAPKQLANGPAWDVVL